MRSRSVRVSSCIALSAALAGPVRVAAQEPEPLTVSTSVADGFISADAPIELRFNRAVSRPAERVAVFIDDIDVTDLFERRSRAMHYDPRVLRGSTPKTTTRVRFPATSTSSSVCAASRPVAQRAS